MRLAPGTVIGGDYQIASLLGEGGMGAVYEVVQKSTGHRRALKLMLPELARDEDHRRRFEQEARIGSRIRSEHVVEVIASGIDEGRPYIVMELLAGMDLAKLIRTRGPIPRDEARAIFEQLSHALSAAHRAGIVHRDLKPEKIFVAKSMHAGAPMTVKILDFGIAKLLEVAVTQRTAAMGTPLWMSPEQADRATITPAADVWAYGLIAFNLLTGVHFWRCTDDGDPTVTALLRDLLIDPIPSATERATARSVSHLLPTGFDAFIARCVVRDPTQRFPDAAAAWAALEPILKSEALAHAATGPLPSAKVAKPKRRSPVAAFIIALCLIAAGVIAFAFSRTKRPKRETVPSSVVSSPPAETTTPIVIAPPSAPAPPKSTQSAPSPPPRKKTGRPIVGGGVAVVLSGKLSERDIKQALSNNVDKLDACYADALKRKPGLEGKLTLKLEISDAGWVKRTEPQAVSDVDEKLVACIQAVMKEPNWGNTVPVVALFPFEFHLE